MFQLILAQPITQGLMVFQLLCVHSHFKNINGDVAKTRQDLGFPRSPWSLPEKYPVPWMLEGKTP